MTKVYFAAIQTTVLIFIIEKTEKSYTLIIIIRLIRNEPRNNNAFRILTPIGRVAIATFTWRTTIITIRRRLCLLSRVYTTGANPMPPHQTADLPNRSTNDPRIWWHEASRAISERAVGLCQWFPTGGPRTRPKWSANEEIQF